MAREHGVRRGGNAFLGRKRGRALGRRFPRWLAVAGALLGLSACSGLERSVPMVLHEVGNSEAEFSAFTLCHGYGCAHQTEVSLEAEEWQRLTAPVQAAQTPEAERAALAQAIGAIEDVVGAKTGTYRDVGLTFAAFLQFKNPRWQMDCVDEMINVATYLTLMERGGALKFHEPARQQTNGFFSNDFWTHTASSMRERETGALYVVDSWWEDNGAPAYIVPVEDWKQGHKHWSKSLAKTDAAAPEIANR